MGVLGALLHLGVDMFLKIEENHVIESLATTTKCADRMRWCTDPLWRRPLRPIDGDRGDKRYPDGPITEGGILVRSLENLQTVYVVEGEFLSTEGAVDRKQKFEFSLHNLPSGSETKTKSWDEWAPESKIPWNTGNARSVIEAIEKELDREGNGQYKGRHGGKPGPPEFFIRLLRRKEVDVGHRFIEGAKDLEVS